MNVTLIIKCGYQDSFYFISQIASIEKVDRLEVYRDEPSLPHKKVVYKSPKSKVFYHFRHAVRMIDILIISHRQKPDLIVGIYEIPHGLIAALAGMFLGIPSVVSIIGNPAYKKVRHGLRLLITMWVLKLTSAITVTGATSKKYLESKGLSPEKIFILPNTIELGNFRYINTDERIYDIISLGVLRAEKRVETVVNVVLEIKKSYAHVKV
ncbi:MAG: glycosyltransferase, partial [Candidatus Cloacimonetes bacterium]|nr:glycosyltransferase [Candidatus Cloacimonadota bacterium]